MPYTQGTPSWVELETADPELAEAFYGTLFGWRFDENRVDVGEPGYTVATLGDEIVAGISPRAATPTTPASWATYLAVDDVEAAAHRVADAGGTVVAGPVDVGSAGRGAVVLDPAGAAVGLWQAGAHEGAAVTGQPGTVSWHELLTGDVDTAVAFYRTVVGVEAEPVERDGASWLNLRAAGREVAGVVAAGSGSPSQWQIWFGVPPDQLDAQVRLAHDLGATVLAEPAATPLGPMAFLLDPQGAGFGLWSNPRR